MRRRTSTTRHQAPGRVPGLPGPLPAAERPVPPEPGVGPAGLHREVGDRLPVPGARAAGGLSRSAFSRIGEYDDVAAWNTWVYNFNEEFDILSPPGSQLEWTVGAFYMNQTQPPVRGRVRVHDQSLLRPMYGADPGATDSAFRHRAEPAGQPRLRERLARGALVDRRRSARPPTMWPTTSGSPAAIRYNYDYDADPSFNFSGFGKSFADNKASTSEPTWRVEGDYDLTPDNMIYGSVARGYKPGGANGSNGQFLVPADLPARDQHRLRDRLEEHVLRPHAAPQCQRVLLHSQQLPVH